MYFPGYPDMTQCSTVHVLTVMQGITENHQREHNLGLLIRCCCSWNRV